MKTSKANTWLVLGASALTVTAAFRASGDESMIAAPTPNERSAAAAQNEKSCTGLITFIDPKTHRISVQNWAMYTRKFNPGANCFYAQVDNNNASATDVRLGEKVTVSYQNSHGVLIADRVQQQSMRFEGTVTAIDNEKHTLTLHRPGLDKVLDYPNDSKITLRDGKYGNFTDIKVGNHVTATYEMPDNEPTIHQLAQTTIPFTGTLTAIDLNEKTVKAKTTFSNKTFQIADNCAIVVNGRTGGQLADLRLKDKLLFSYDEVNGVAVVTRIGPADEPAPAVASDSRTEGYGYDAAY